jgi:branched-subunit amino acid permease
VLGTSTISVEMYYLKVMSIYSIIFGIFSITKVFSTNDYSPSIINMVPLSDASIAALPPVAPIVLAGDPCIDVNFLYCQV